MTIEKLIDLLLDYGFSSAQVEEIIARVACGQTIDSAMQSI